MPHGLEVATAVAERLRKGMQDTPIEALGVITLSLGVARWDAQGDETPADVLNRADRALYAAKQAGRNRVVAEHAR